MILVAYLLAVAAWLGASFMYGTRAPWELYATALILHVLVGWRLLGWGRRDLGSAYRSSLLFAGVGLAIPATAPVAICLVAGGVIRRASRRRGAEDPLGQDFSAAVLFWWGTAVAGAILGAVWTYAAIVTLAEFAGTRSFHPWQDPLATFPIASGVPLRFALVGLSIWYGALLWRTFVLLSRDEAPRSWGAPDEEVLASDTIY